MKNYRIKFSFFPDALFHFCRKFTLIRFDAVNVLSEMLKKEFAPSGSGFFYHS